MILKRIKNINEFVYFSYMVNENNIDNKYEKSEEWDTIIK